MTGSRMLRFGWAMSILARRVREPSGNSPSLIRRKQVQILRDGAVAVGAFLAGGGERAAVLADLIGGQVADVGLAVGHQLFGPLVELTEVVGGVQLAVLPVGAEPAHVCADGIDVLLLLLHGVGVVVAEVELAAVLLGEAEVEADRLGVADVEVAVRLGREARVDAAAEPAGAVVLLDDLLDEIQRWGVGFVTFAFGLASVRSVRHSSLSLLLRPTCRTE